MAAVTPFEFEPTTDVIGLSPENFPVPAKALSVADPMNSAAGASTYRMSRMIMLPRGMISVRSQADDSASWWIGVDGISTRMVHNHVGYNVVSDWEFYSEGGLFRLDVILQNIPTGANPCWFIYAMRRGSQIIDVSRASDWLTDTAPIPDEDLQAVNDPRRSLPVWSIMPNWKGGVTERLTWLTDVLQSDSGAEQRRAVRQHPRRSIEAGFLRKGAQRARIDAFLSGVGRGELLVPLWFEAVRMLEGITPGASGVSFATPNVAQREFREGDLVLVSTGNPADYDILQVGAVSASRFDWAESPARGWPPGTRIYPLREARIMDPPQVSHPVDRVAVTQIRFELVRPDPRPASWGGFNPATPLFNFKPNRAEPVAFTYERKTFNLDNQVGRVQVTDLGDSQVAMRLDLTLRGRTAVYQFRQMLAAAMGRTNPFTCATFLHDIEPVGTIPAGTTIECEAAGFSDYLDISQPTRRTIVIYYKNGATPQYRNIIGSEAVFVEGVHVRDRIFLDVPLSETTRAEIERICFAVPTRLDQDAIEMQHLVGASVAVRSSLVLRQLANRRTAELWT